MVVGVRLCVCTCVCVCVCGGGIGVWVRVRVCERGRKDDDDDARQGGSSVQPAALPMRGRRVFACSGGVCVAGCVCVCVCRGGGRHTHVPADHKKASKAQVKNRAAPSPPGTARTHARIGSAVCGVVVVQCVGAVGCAGACVRGGRTQEGPNTWLIWFDLWRGLEGRRGQNRRCGKRQARVCVCVCVCGCVMWVVV